MSKSGVDWLLYYCPKLNRKVLLSLDYFTLMSDKIYTSLECESKSNCDDTFDKCTAHKIYIEGL